MKNRYKLDPVWWMINSSSFSRDFWIRMNSICIRGICIFDRFRWVNNCPGLPCVMAPSFGIERLAWQAEMTFGWVMGWAEGIVRVCQDDRTDPGVHLSLLSLMEELLPLPLYSTGTHSSFSSSEREKSDFSKSLNQAMWSLLLPLIWSTFLNWKLRRSLPAVYTYSTPNRWPLAILIYHWIPRVTVSQLFPHFCAFESASNNEFYEPYMRWSFAESQPSGFVLDGYCASIDWVLTKRGRISGKRRWASLLFSFLLAVRIDRWNGLNVSSA